MKDLPANVIEAMFHLSNGSQVGLETYKCVEETVKQYPEYFPWETKYNSIDKSVHEKYEDELSLLFKSFFPPTPMDIQPGEGIYAWSKRVSEESFKNKEPFSTKTITDKINKEYEFKKAKEKLWNKHYRKYKLKYPL